MLRSSEERLFAGRTYTRIETWEEFLVRWQAVDTEEEANQLLYVGSKVPPFNLKDGCDPEGKQDAAIGERMKFFAAMADLGSVGMIRDTAAQLLVKEWLRRIYFRRLFQPGQQIAFEAAIEFLNSRRVSLCSPPYPRFIGEFLATTAEHWKNGSSPEYQKGSDFKFLQMYSVKIIKAACLWGMAHKLAGSPWRKDAITELENFLAGDPHIICDVLTNLAVHCTQPADLSSRPEDALTNAAAALLVLKYRAGSGINEKMRERIPI